MEGSVSAFRVLAFEASARHKEAMVPARQRGWLNGCKNYAGAIAPVNEAHF